MECANFLARFLNVRKSTATEKTLFSHKIENYSIGTTSFAKALL